MTTVSEATETTMPGGTVTTPSDAPDVITWTMGIVTHQTARARKVEADIAGDNARLENLDLTEQRIRAEFDKKIAEVAAQRGPIKERLKHAKTELAAVLRNAEVAHEMAARACDTHGWDLPSPPADVDVKATGAQPALTPERLAAMDQTRPDMLTCRFCGKEIRQVNADSWIHTMDGAIYCAGSETTYAQPDGVTDGDPAGNTTQVPSVFFEGDPTKQHQLPDNAAEIASSESPSGAQQVARTGAQPSAAPKRRTR